MNALVKAPSGAKVAGRLDRAWARLELRRDGLFREMAAAEATGDVQRAAVAALHVFTLMRRTQQLLAVQKRRGL